MSFFFSLLFPFIFIAQANSDENACEGVFKGIIPCDDPSLVGDLGEKIKNGTIGLSDIPQIIIHFIDLGTLLAGTICVLFLIYGGYQYLISGISENKQAGKNTVKWAIIGLIVTFSAWIIVNIIQVQMTSTLSEF